MGLPGKLDQAEIDARVRRITDLVEELTAQRAEDRIGERVEVLLTEDLSADRGPGRLARPRRAPGPRRRRDDDGRRRARRRGAPVSWSPPRSSTPRASTSSPARSSPAPVAGRVGDRRDRRRPGPGRHAAAVGEAGQPAQRADRAAAGRRAGVRGAAAARTAAWTTPARYWATLVFALAIITDRYDGMIARRTGQVTEFGKLADPIADKALTGTALIGLSILGLLPWWVTVVILVREVGVTVLRFWVIRHGVIAGQPRRQGEDRRPGAGDRALHPAADRAGWPRARWWVMAAALVLTVAHRASTTSTARSPCAGPARGRCGPRRPGGPRARPAPAAPAPTPPPEKGPRPPHARASAGPGRGPARGDRGQLGARLHADLAAQDAAEGVVLAAGGDPVTGRLVGLDERPLPALPERLGEHGDVHRLDGRRPAGPPGGAAG